MENQRAFLVSTHRDHFQAGQPAEILGVRFITPDGLTPRTCYHLLFPDGREDFMPLSEAHHFEIISEDDHVAGKIPAVTN